MGWIAGFFNGIENHRMKAFGLAAIENVPLDLFKQTIQEHIDSGWEKTYEYENFDSWIDVARVDLRKEKAKLQFRWWLFLDGRITGPRKLIHALADRLGLVAVEKIK
jgi:hypothetical protein